MNIEVTEFEQAKQFGLQALQEALDLRPSERNRIRLVSDETVVLINGTNSQYAFYIQVGDKKPLPDGTLLLVYFISEGFGPTIVQAQLSTPDMKPAFEYQPYIPDENGNAVRSLDLDFVQPLRYAAMGKDNVHEVIDILADVVKNLADFELQMNSAQALAFRTRSLDGVDLILKERAELLSIVPVLLEVPIRSLDITIQRRVLPAVNLIAQKARVALEDDSDSGRTKLTLLPMFYTSSIDKVGDKNDFEKMIDFIRAWIAAR